MSKKKSPNTKKNSRRTKTDKTGTDQKHKSEQAENLNADEEQITDNRFVRDLLIRGEAAETDAEGQLPPGATHKIVENCENDDEPPKIERERFSLY